MDRIARAGEQALAAARNHRDGGSFVWKVPTAEQIRELRQSLGLTQRAFCQRYQIDLNTLKSWETNRKKPSQPSALLLAMIKHCNQEYLTIAHQIMRMQSVEDEANAHISCREPEFI